MPQRHQIGNGRHAITDNLFARLGEGYGWVRGAGVTLGGSSTDITVRVGDGLINVSGSPVSVASQTVTLPDGNASAPRRDLVYIDREGTAQFEQGEAGGPLPPDKTRENTKVPAPPAAAAIDGVPVADVWVPAGATSAADLDPDDVTDQRVADQGALGGIPTREDDPPRDELLQTRWWRNETAGELRAYFADVDEIHRIDTTQVQTFSGDNTVLIESFDESITANWVGGDSTFKYEATPSIEGDAAAFWDDGGNTTDYSIPGDGLPYYPQPGDTIAMGVRQEGTDRVVMGFGKEADDVSEDYRVQLRVEEDEVRLVRDDVGSQTTLGSISASLSKDTWYILEADYDGGGEGTHPFRVYSVDGSGNRDTVLGEETSPTTDTTYRGRGVLIRALGRARFDYLHAIR
jgi:hypothetical protein